VQFVDGLGVPPILAPARIVGIHDAVTATRKSASADDLPVPDTLVTRILNIGQR